MNKWMVTLMKLLRSQAYFTSSSSKKNKRGMMWASLVSVVVSVVALSFRKAKRSLPVNMTSDFQKTEPRYKPNIAAIVESSEELAPQIKAYKEFQDH
jgi:hypothetical protein